MALIQQGGRDDMAENIRELVDVKGGTIPSGVDGKRAKMLGQVR